MEEERNADSYILENVNQDTALNSELSVNENTENIDVVSEQTERNAPSLVTVYNAGDGTSAAKPVYMPSETEPETPSASLVTPSPEEDLSTPEHTTVAHDNSQTNENFYSENVKFKGKRGRGLGGTFKGIAVLVAVASLFFGLGLGAMLPISNQIAKSISVEATEQPEAAGAFMTNTTLPDNTTETPQGTQAYSTSSSLTDGGIVYSYSAIISSVEPSVVSITGTSQNSGMQSFFGASGEQVYAGTGILFHETDTKYYIVTNYHVVTNQYTGQSLSLEVSISDSTLIPARIVGFDSPNDLAVISLEKTDVRAAGINSVHLAIFGDSDAMNVGDVVLAIGNAMGEGNTATNGIISAKDKTISVEGKTLEVIQTNAAINFGNSGGPLVNLRGEVIGINTAKISESNTEGMGYSIPSNIAKPIISDIMDVINKPYLGIVCGTITESAATQYSLPSAGAYITEVAPGSPAEKAGILPQDIITSYNGQPVLSSNQLVEYVGAGNIGDEVEIKLIRDGKDYLTITATLGQR